MVTGIIFLTAVSGSWVGSVLLGSLEDDYEARDPVSFPEVDVIVVLGGFTSPPVPPRADIDVNDSADRLLHGMRLWRAGRASRLLLTGGVSGDSNQTRREFTEAFCAKRLALECQIDSSAIIIEGRARNTFDNGQFVKEILENQGFTTALLVTSGWHMPRAVAVFERAGIDVVPAPTDLRVLSTKFRFSRLFPSLEALRFSSIAIKEYAGLAAYRILGWI